MFLWRQFNYYKRCGQIKWHSMASKSLLQKPVPPAVLEMLLDCSGSFFRTTVANSRNSDIYSWRHWSGNLPFDASLRRFNWWIRTSQARGLGFLLRNMLFVWRTFFAVGTRAFCCDSLRSLRLMKLAWGKKLFIHRFVPPAIYIDAAASCCDSPSFWTMAATGSWMYLYIISKQHKPMHKNFLPRALHFWGTTNVVAIK